MNSEDAKGAKEKTLAFEDVIPIRGRCIEAGSPEPDGKVMVTLEVEFFDLVRQKANPLYAEFVVIPKAQYAQLIEPLRVESLDRFMGKFVPAS